MTLPLSKLSLLRNRLPASLDATLRISWWTILLVLLFLVLADGAIFYQYGLGHAYPQVTGGNGAIIRINEKAIGDAEEIIKNKRADFEAAEPAAADLPNPFR